MSGFAIFFTGKTCLIPDTAFKQVDPTHWLLDVSSTLPTIPYSDLKEAALMLLQPHTSLPANMALSLYISLGDNRNWIYCGYVHNNHASDVLPLQWPPIEENLAPIIGPGFAQIGVTLEPLAEVEQKESVKLAAKEEFVKMVGMDLFNFMQSFNVQQHGDTLVVPSNILDKWYQRLSHKLQRDPDFLTRDKNKV